MATTLIKLMEATVADLQAAGIRATADPRSLNPPCVLVLPPSIALDASCGGLATCQAHVVTRGPGNADAWKSVDDLTGKVAEVVDLEAIEPSSYAVDNGAPMPTYLLTWTKAISWP